MPYLKLMSIVALASVAAGPVTSIPLRAGAYGGVGLACSNEPNAAIMSFDGLNFAYPHASQCTDTVIGRSSRILTISETCRGLGDGSPAKPDTMTFKLRPHGDDRFDLIKATNITTFRRCGEATFFDKH